jgi:hypothetical protein
MTADAAPSAGDRASGSSRSRRPKVRADWDSSATVMPTLFDDTASSLPFALAASGAGERRGRKGRRRRGKRGGGLRAQSSAPDFGASTLAASEAADDAAASAVASSSAADAAAPAGGSSGSSAHEARSAPASPSASLSPGPSQKAPAYAAEGPAPPSRGGGRPPTQPHGSGVAASYRAGSARLTLPPPLKVGSVGRLTPANRLRTGAARSVLKGIRSATQSVELVLAGRNLIGDGGGNSVHASAVHVATLRRPIVADGDEVL